MQERELLALTEEASDLSATRKALAEHTEAIESLNAELDGLRAKLTHQDEMLATLRTEVAAKEVANAAAVDAVRHVPCRAFLHARRRSEHILYITRGNNSSRGVRCDPTPDLCARSKYN